MWNTNGLTKVIRAGHMDALWNMEFIKNPRLSLKDFGLLALSWNNNLKMAYVKLPKPRPYDKVVKSISNTCVVDLCDSHGKIQVKVEVRLDLTSRLHGPQRHLRMKVFEPSTMKFLPAIPQRRGHRSTKAWIIQRAITVARKEDDELNSTIESKVRNADPEEEECMEYDSEEDEVYKVERIKDCKKKDNGVWEYYVLWKGHSSEFNMWEPETCFSINPQLLIDFWGDAPRRSHPDQKNKLRQLQRIALECRNPGYDENHFETEIKNLRIVWADFGKRKVSEPGNNEEWKEDFHQQKSEKKIKKSQVSDVMEVGPRHILKDESSGVQFHMDFELAREEEMLKEILESFYSERSKNTDQDAWLVACNIKTTEFLSTVITMHLLNLKEEALGKDLNITHPQLAEYFQEEPYRTDIDQSTGKENSWWTTDIMENRPKGKCIKARVLWYSLKTVIKVFAWGDQAKEIKNIIIPRWYRVTNSECIWQVRHDIEDQTMTS